MDAEAAAPLLAGTSHAGTSWDLRGTFAASLAGLTTLLLVLLALFGQYAADLTDANVDRYYAWLSDVYVMVFLGFGFLMTFLRRYSYSAVSLNFVCSCLVILEALLAIGWVQQGWGTVSVDLPLLIDAAFCAGAAMISFGAVLGKASPAQLLWLLALEVPLYALNAQVVTGRWGALDVGGSITIHAFGAVYGLAASVWLSPKGAGSGHPKNGASYASDMTAMLGTLFLFIYWPSFNGALATAPGTDAQPRAFCVMNTVLALLGACLAGFAASAATGQLDMVHVQNATLAGGVAIGSAANLVMPPACALAVGIAAGALSTCGYLWLSPALERTCGVTDTCGVANLHGMPGVLGGLASALFAHLFYPANAALVAHGAKGQPGVQLAGLGCTLAAAAVGGACAGWAVSRASPAGQSLAAEDMFEDAHFWHEVEKEE
uniref:RHP1 protein n=1 Tax=Chlorella sp. ArM0029B TaxID=1415603 RepID=A0A345AXC9_9CHLO|nr:RHP1 protein [Chlorella sp. ArM0029B]